jgi:hypothetical protein
VARRYWFCTALIAALAASALPAAADLQTVIGARTTVTGESVATCGVKAKNALDTVLRGAFESDSGSGEWLAYGGTDTSQAAAVHCYTVGNGYVVTFTCAAQIPPSLQTASVLCDKLAAAFPGAGGAAPAVTSPPRSSLKGGSPW